MVQELEPRDPLIVLERRLDEAEGCYDQALTYVENEPRGRAKAQAGRELIRYMRDVESGGTGQQSAEATARIAADPAARKHVDMTRIAAVNSQRMRDQRMDPLPYEML
ncbi:MAG: hypothetical protein ACRDRG_03765 [Pseudonocardiaceae bacterium]